MDKFIKKVAYFLILLIILSLPLDYTISYFLKNSFVYPGELEVMNDIYNRKANCEIAIYGSSRAWVHINPKLIEDSLNQKAYNFGIDGHNFWLQYLRHIEYIKHNDRPKLIVLSVDMFSLMKRKDLYQPNQFLPFMLWNKNITRFTSSYVGFSKTDYYIPLIRYIGKATALNSALETAFKSTIKKSNIPPIRHKGFAGMDREWNKDLEKAKSNKIEYEIKLDMNSINLFEDFIKECQKTKVELILVYTPEYIEGQNFVANRDNIIRVYKEFSVKYHLQFFDYSTDEICFNKSLFYNASHLNKYGADLFTNKLIGDLKARTHNNMFVPGGGSVSQ